MPYNSYTNGSGTIYLKDYASFIKNNRLDDLVPAYLMTMYSFQIPLLQFFAHLNEEQKIARAKEGIVRLLTNFEKENAIDEVKQTLSNWKNNGIPNIPRDAISMKDITLIYSAQKITFQSFLPYYTSDVAVATQVINEIEMYYKQVQEMALEMVETIQQEEYIKRIESEEKYKDLFDNASDLIHIASSEGSLLYVNNAWKQTLGYNDEELKGKLIYEFVGESDRDNFKSYREQVISGRVLSKNIRTCYIKKNGEQITVEGTINCKYKHGKPQYTRGMLRDISSNIKQENKIKFYVEQLAESEENLRDIIDKAPDGVIVIDRVNTILLWNPKAEEIFGWTKEEVIGKNMANTITPVHLRASHNNGLNRYLSTRKPHILNQTVEVPALHKNGHEFFISLTVSHATQAGKDIFIAFLRDITRQKENQLELESKSKQLERSNNELQQYAWLTSHDLKEPLRKILTFSDVLLRKQDKNISEQSLGYLSKIQSSAMRMNKLIEAVLEYSNVTANRELFVETDLNNIVHEVIDDLEIIILTNTATIQSEKLPVIEAIPIQIRQLFQNLIGNGIKYRKPTEAPIINITCRQVKQGYEIRVTDNGIGFEKIYADKIFKAFQRLSTKTAYEGTGIGLALCKKIAESHQGYIYAESEPGVGSTFVVYLPEKH